MVSKQTASSKVHTQSCFSHEDPELSKISLMLKRAQGRERMSVFPEGAPSLGEGQGQRHLGGRGREVCPEAWLSGRMCLRRLQLRSGVHEGPSPPHLSRWGWAPGSPLSVTRAPTSKHCLGPSAGQDRAAAVHTPAGGSDQGCSRSEAGIHGTENVSEAQPEVIRVLARYTQALLNARFYGPTPPTDRRKL